MAKMVNRISDLGIPGKTAGKIDDVIAAFRSRLNPIGPRLAPAMGVMDDAGDTGAVSKLYNDLIKKVEIKQAKKGVKINKTADTADDIGDAGRRAGVEAAGGAHIDDTLKQLNTKLDEVELPEGTWNKKPTDRGKDIDNLMDNNVGSNYPVIDKIDENGIVTSVKSRDLNCKTYQNGKTLENTIKKDIDKLTEYNGKNWGGTNIKANQINGKQLKMVVPNTSLSNVQIEAINSAIQYGKSKGIDIIITVGR